MPHQPSENWAETYINDGYPDLVIPQECDEIKSEMLKIFRGDYECTAIPPMSENATETEVLDRIMCVGEPHTFSPLIQQYVEHPRICAILREIVGGFNGPQECDEIKSEMLKIFRGDYECTAIPPMSENATETEVLDRIMCVGEPHTFSPLIQQYVEHPRICAILREIVGAHIPFWDSGVKCMQSMMLGKVPGHTGNPWHQDEHPIPTRDRSLVGAWITLDDATINNGCIWVLPNSHRSGIIYDRHPHKTRRV